MDNPVYIFDIELYTAIKPGVKDPAPGIECVDNWNKHDQMQMSCCAVLELDNRCAPLMYCRDNIREFQQLVTPDAFFVSHNGKFFDLPVLAKYGISIPPEAHYDIMDEWVRATGRRVALDALATGNCGVSKSGDSSSAPEDWQGGRIGKVLMLNLGDVFMTQAVYRLILKQGWLTNPYTGERVTLPRPGADAVRAGRLF